MFGCGDSDATPDPSFSQGIPEKGKLLTKISLFWFNKLADIIPNHFVTADIDEMPEEVRQYKDQLEGRTMLVKKAEVVPLEAIVRGYVTGVYLLSWLRTVWIHLAQALPGRNTRRRGQFTAYQLKRT